MGLLKRSDLIFEDYKWTVYGNDDPETTGEPDSTLFNKNEGYEVLYLINKFASKNSFKKKETGLKIEKMLHEYLPGNIRSQKNVVSWIVENWEKY